MGRLVGVLALVVIAVATSTCGDSTGAVPVDHVVVSGRAGLRVGEMVSFVARAFDARGDTLPGLPLTWSSSNSLVAGVSTSGLVTTHAPGQTTISAVAAGITGSLLVTVTLRPVAGIQVLPGVDSLFPDDSLQLTSVLMDSTGTAVTGRAIEWRSSDTTRGVVSSGGLVVARAVGGVAISLTSEGQVGGAFLAVQYPVASLRLPDSLTMTTRQVVQLIPDLRSANDVHLAGRPVTWRSADTAIVRISTVGVVTPAGRGTVAVFADCCGGLQDSTVVSVVSEPVQRIDLLVVGTGVILVDSVARAQVVLLDRFSLPTDRPVSWSASDSSIVRVTPDSLEPGVAWVRGLRPGLVAVRAISDTAHASADIFVDLPADRLVLEPDTVRVRVGEFAPVHRTLQDAAGNVRGDPIAVTWATTDTSIALAASGSVAGRRTGQTTAIGVLGDPVQFADTITIVVSPDGGTRLDWNVPATFADIYTSLTDTISLTDSAGAPLAVGQDVRLESADTSVVSVTPMLLPALSGGAPVTLYARRGGAVTIIARTDSLAAPFWIRVLDIPIATLDLTTPRILRVGDSIPLDVSRLDDRGVPHEYPLLWSSSDSSVAIATDSSILIARAPGRAVLTVQSGGLRDTATITVTTLTGPSITAVEPSPLLADSLVTITGADFDPAPVNNTVLVDGVPATVTAATSTQLTARLADAANYPCAPTHLAEVSVATAAGLGAVTATFTAARQISLQVGEVTPLRDAATSSCNELAQTGGAYDITVMNQAPSAQTAIDYQVRLAAAPPNLVPPPAPTTSAPDGDHAQGPSLPDIDLLRRSLPVHRRLLEQSRQLTQRLGSPIPLLRARTRLSMSIADSVGALVRFRIPDLTRPDFCAGSLGVTARRAYVGTHLDIYEDTDNAVAGSMDGAFAQLGLEFDNVMYPVLLINFGDPLRLDSLLDRNGKIVLLVSPKVNDLAAGFVVSCDFYPETVAPSSNTGEIIYTFAPTSTSPNFEAGSVSVWKWLIRSVLMHESKHITAFVERFSRGAPLEEVWLEEGSAVIAEELWARRVYQVAWKGNANYLQTLYCDVRPTTGTCAGRPYAMFNAFALLHDYADGYAAPPGNEAHTPLGPTDPTDATFYGSAWSLLRWSIDQYAGSESAFITALLQDPSRTGVANLEARTGQPFPSLVADWLLASQLDDRQASARFNVLSWNTPIIFAGMSTDFPASFPRPFPYRMRTVSFGDDVTLPIPRLHGGTGSVFRIEGTQRAKQLIALESLGGGSVPPGLWIEILRAQ